MNRDEVRLELLKLTFRKDLGPESAVEAAKILEAYVIEDKPVKTPSQPLQVESEKKKPGRPPKADNPFL